MFVPPAVKRDIDMNRFHQSFGQRWKRAQRDNRLAFSFNWRGTFKTQFAARPYTQADLAREERAYERELA